MKNIFCIAVVFLASVVSVYGQFDVSVSPNIKTFALQPDDIGNVQNSVNLFTGDVALPVNLLTLPGRGGLDVDVSISYSSDVDEIVGTWNREAPTGILGLGWNMSIPKIVADTKQTGTRLDDDFYLVEGGTSNLLVRTLSGTTVISGATVPYYEYEARNYQPWKIRFYYNGSDILGGVVGNKWEIIHEDGTRYIYGDENSGRNTIQYTVRWSNWIGNSSRTSGQLQLATVWNLSEIINVWGDKVTFEYDNVDQFVGSSSGKKHTEASYLKQITDVVGRKIQFVYSDKASQHFVEPHTEQAEPDAYQEFYEKKYLDHIDVLNEYATKFLTIQFGYGVLSDQTSQAKMLLTSIEQRNALSNALPKMKFDYTMDGAQKGFLRTVTYPTGGSVSYEYTQKTIDRSNRDLKINAPAGYAEPRVWMADDYVVVAWRQLANGAHNSGSQYVYLSVYQWIGEWKEKYIGSFYGVTLAAAPNGDDLEYANFSVTTQEDFFSVLSSGSLTTNYTLGIYYKDPQAPGDWKSFSRSVNMGGTAAPTLVSGDRFVMVGSYRDDGYPLRRYVFDGSTWVESPVDQEVGNHFYTGTNNYYISHNRQDNGNNLIYFTYLTDDGKWKTNTIPASLTIGAGDNRSYWYSSNDFAVVLAYGLPEYVYRWDITYGAPGIGSFSWDRYDVSGGDLFGGNIPDETPAFIVNNSLVGIKSRVCRFDGQSWYGINIPATGNTYSTFFYTYGEDLAVRPVGSDPTAPGYYKGTRSVFNPNTLQWSDYLMQGTEAGNDFVDSGLDHYFFGLYYYYRSPNGTWSRITTSPGFRWSVGSGYPRFNLWYNSGSSTIGFANFKNGQLSMSSITNADVFKKSYYYDLISNATGPYTFVTFPYAATPQGSVSMNTYATSLTLYRVVNDAYTGKQKDYVVTLVTTTEGDKTRYTTLDYNLITAVMEPAGTTALYNEVDVIPGSISYKDRPNGYTKLFFNNCLGTDETRIINAAPSLYWKGANYEIRAYSASVSSPVSTSKTTFTPYTRDILNDQGTKTRLGYYVRPTKVVVVQDGITVTTDNTYDASTGLLTQTIVSGPVTLQTNYAYFYQAYDPTRSLNRLTPVVFTKQKTNGVNTAANAVRYKGWNVSSSNPAGILAPADTYSWKRSGSVDFSTWDVNSVPSYSEWLKTGAVTMRDLTGTVIETADGLNRPVTNSILDFNRFRVIASTTNAALSDVGYTGFETDALGNIQTGNGTIVTTDAKTGSACMSLGSTALSKNGFLTAQTYRISFWAKSGTGQISICGGAPVTLNTSDWKLFEYTVSNVSQITIARGSSTAVLIDEVRIRPVGASMNTYVYDPVYGVKSQTDENGQTVYYDFDEWGRIKTVKDDGKNITTVRSYNFKN